MLRPSGAKNWPESNSVTAPRILRPGDRHPASDGHTRRDYGHCGIPKPNAVGESGSEYKSLDWNKRCGGQSKRAAIGAVPECPQEAESWYKKFAAAQAIFPAATCRSISLLEQPLKSTRSKWFGPTPQRVFQAASIDRIITPTEGTGVAPANYSMHRTASWGSSAAAAKAITMGKHSRV